MAIASPLASYRQQDRREAADVRLAAIREEVDQLTRAWEARNPSADPEELRVLRERLQGARGQVKVWTRYIKNGCPRGR
ncbi:hypothetical protein ACFYP4_02945 [Streptomyces sp. NPDC005551]|uniref:hypothetical protein n=1 Tax=Streptomyces sp. NPDC005551 TaxID=3364725 RepID=UPI00367472A4